jgi:hypothetical protein
MSELTTVKLLSNIDITNDYKNSFTFATLSTQTAFFLSKTNTTFSNLTYQRKERSIRVKENIETLFNVSYLMFQNANFGVKWFYGFIVDMKYLNPETTEIFFEIDVLQTWKFDVDYKYAYIEREHVADDTIGLNLLSENIDVGEYVVNDSETVAALETMSIIVATTTKRDGSGGFEDVQGDSYSGIYSGVAFIPFGNYAAGITLLNSFLADITADGKAESIISIFLTPTILLPATYTNGSPLPSDDAWTTNIEFTANHLALDYNYSPKNNKLFVFPYNFLYVTNNQGASATFKYL